MTEATIYKTAWGWMGLAVSPNGVCRIVLPRSSRRTVESELNGVQSPEPVRVSRVLSSRLREAKSQIDAYLRGRRRVFALPFDLSDGTPFQRRVWRAAMRIPYGRVRSYRWVATKIGGKRYARAAGMALGANPIPLVVPCHRVLSFDGTIGGFSGGLRTKRRLLKLEGTLPQPSGRNR